MTEATREKKPRARKPPDLVGHRKVAQMLGTTTQQIRRWAERGSFPLPHSVIETTWFYRADHIRAFLESGKWPDGVRFNGRRRGGEE